MKYMTYRWYILIYLLVMIPISLVAVPVQPVKILFVIDKFPWYTKMPIIHQMNTLIENGHDVQIYARTRKQSHNVEPAIYKHNLLSRTHYEVLPANLDSYDVVMCQYGNEGKRMVSILKEHNFKGKLITCIRGGDITSRKEIIPHAYDELFERGDLFLPVCEYFRFRLIITGCDPSRIRVLHSAIDTSKFIFRERSAKKSKTIRIASVGRLDEEKGIKYAILAVAKLLRKYKHIEYLIVGDGKERDALASLIKELGVEKNIKMLGWKSQEEISRLLDTLDFFIHPAVTPERGATEGIPNALKEAMASGLPVIGTYHAGVPELIVDGVSGFLVPERDVDSLIQKIDYLINRPDIFAAMGKAGRLMIEEQFENTKVNMELLAIINEIGRKK